MLVYQQLSKCDTIVEFLVDFLSLLPVFIPLKKKVMGHSKSKFLFFQVGPIKPRITEMQTARSPRVEALKAPETRPLPCRPVPLGAGHTAPIF